MFGNDCIPKHFTTTEQGSKRTSDCRRINIHPNDDTQNYPFYRLEYETIGRST